MLKQFECRDIYKLVASEVSVIVLPAVGERRGVSLRRLTASGALRVRAPPHHAPSRPQTGLRADPRSEAQARHLRADAASGSGLLRKLKGELAVWVPSGVTHSHVTCPSHLPVTYSRPHPSPFSSPRACSPFPLLTASFLSSSVPGMQA